MKKISLLFILFFGMILTLGQIQIKAQEPVDVFDFTYNINYNNQTNAPVTVQDISYGMNINLDSGSFGQEGYEFLGFMVQGKVNPSLNPSTSIRVTENMSVELFYKPTNSTAVIFIDSNQDLIDVLYTDGSGLLNQSNIPDYNIYTKPGLTPIGWSHDLTQVFNEDMIVYVEYQNQTNDQLSLEVINGTGTNNYLFNEIVTVSATGTGSFDYWLKDGKIASLNETYTFTMADNHRLEAVYDTGFVKNSDQFIHLSSPLEIRTGYVSFLGQFTIANNKDIVEYGMIFSDMPGAITLDTPGVQIINSNKYNAQTNEFVLSIQGTVDTLSNHRAFIRTIDEFNQVETTYSYYQEGNVATDLIISEYIEGSSNNKTIELYNGTGFDIDLSSYSLELYSNGSSTPSSTESSLSGTISHGETFVLWNSSSVSTFQVLPGKSSNVANFNGDDAIVLKKGTQVIDSIGQIGIDPGSNWGSSSDVTASFVDKTLVRKASVLSGDTNASDTYVSDEWIEYAQDTTTYLGAHTMDNVSTLVTDVDLVSGLTLSALTELNVGSTTEVTLSYDSSGLEGIVWYSSNQEVASVDDNGLVTALSAGTTTITAFSYYDHRIFDSVTINVTQPTTYTISFESNGGSVIASQSLLEGEHVQEPDQPIKQGYTFEGWYSDAQLTTQFNFSLAVNNDFTLYAKWTETVTQVTHTEDFTNFNQGSYGNGSFVGVNNITWTYTTAYGSTYFQFKDSGSLSATFSEGISEVTIVASAFSTGRSFNISINGTLYTFTNIGTTEVSYTISNINVPGDVNFIIDNPSASTKIHSITWTTYGSSTPIEDTTAPEITLNSQKFTYVLGDTVNLGCSAYDQVDGNVVCEVSGTVDSNTLGSYQITYSATDLSGNEAIQVETYQIVEATDYLAMDLMTYYDSAEGLEGQALEIALRTIVSDYTYTTYDDARYILDESDVDPNNPNNIILVYTRYSVSGVWDAGATWNREHVWPQSLLGYDSTMSADLHNLKPADPGENSSRSNKYYDVLTTSSAYEPPDEVKGDVARILFYMMIRYEVLELVDTAPTTYQMGLLETLLTWHDLDPVDDFERNRNDVIYSYQNNRNPFIDYEHFVELIFGYHSYYNN